MGADHSRSQTTDDGDADREEPWVAIDREMRQQWPVVWAWMHGRAYKGHELVTELRRALDFYGEPRIKYPHDDGDFLVLGPELFTLKNDYSVISWRGQNYAPQPGAAKALAGPHDFAPLRWLRRDRCRHCGLSKGRHPTDGWVPARALGDTRRFDDREIMKGSTNRGGTAPTAHPTAPEDVSDAS